MRKVTGQQWQRVKATPVSVVELEKREANKNTFNSPQFKTECISAGVEVTKRQTSKWNNNKGKAYKMKNNIEMEGVRVDV